MKPTEYTRYNTNNPGSRGSFGAKPRETWDRETALMDTYNRTGSLSNTMTVDKEFRTALIDNISSTIRKQCGVSDTEHNEEICRQLTRENNYLKDRFTKLRRNYTEIERDLQTNNEKKCADVFNDDSEALRKENRRLNKILKETIFKNEQLLSRVTSIEDDQKYVG